MEKTDMEQWKQSKSKPWQFKPGVSGNPAGRPRGAFGNARITTEIGMETLDKLEDMTKRELIALIRRVSGAMWGIGIMTDEEAYDAICLKLLHGGLTQTDTWKALPPLKEWADRKRGKPAQSIAMKVEVDPIQKMSTERLLRLENELARSIGQEPTIIPPMPELLGDDD
ncbi:MAG: DUF5681 domain-containing protein [Rickettsiales bacterium]|nr:DUF5681 domain-containing protein [Rickettsiales bacterium]